jgi:cellulose synthase/poly-beta-1,6-N-acetylglucosamine synthase-like glycosyltransferase
MGDASLTWLFYPLLSAALFFEIFLLITFISRPARLARGRGAADKTPFVALIVPCYNEERTVEKTVRSVLSLSYPADRLQLILVNDGSTDDTHAEIEKFRSNPQVRIIHQKNGGKHTALNAGIALAVDAEFVGCVDADTELEADALTRTLACFTHENVAASFSSIVIGSPQSALEYIQGAEYMMGSYFRHALASINAFFVTPGPFSVYRRAILLEIGGFRFGQQTEDMDIAMRLLKRGYHIENAPGALVTTRAQDTFGKLVRQRMRWASGYFRNIWFDHRDLVSSKYGFLGLFVLPLGFATPALMIGTALLSLYLFTTGVAGFVLAHRGIPVLWSLSSLDRHLSWFYLPINGLTLLAFVVLILAALSAALGKYISGTKEGFARGIILYTLFYGFLAPVWYARSIYDVSTGTRRGWRD